MYKNFEVGGVLVILPRKWGGLRNGLEFGNVDWIGVNTAISFRPKMGLPNAPEIAECDASTSFVFPRTPRDVREAGIIGIGVHMWRPRCTWQNREFGMLPPQKSSDLTWSSFGLNSEFYFSLKYILMVEKSPALICAWEVFQFLGQSSRNCRPLWIRWTFASNCR